MKSLSLLALISLSVLASPLQLKGSYFFQRGEKKPVTFSLRWVEKNGQVTGFYSDNRFTNRSLVTGQSTDNGRTFEILLPQASNGVKSFSILTSSGVATQDEKEVSLQLVARDIGGTPLSIAKFDAQFSEIIPAASAAVGKQAQEARPCSEGFGEMAGYCGVYGGMLSEESDTGKVCDLLSSNTARLELDNEANVIFHTETPSEKNSQQDHLIGRIPSGTESRNVDLMSRHCRPLQGTNFPGDDCKRINLIGTFSSKNGSPHFTGTYVIIDEKNDRSCRYSMTMDRVNRI